MSYILKKWEVYYLPIKSSFKRHQCEIRKVNKEAYHGVFPQIKGKKEN